ncbi:MAG: 50S ribosomal protein L11 methyltransferase [Magnetococcales bacterium]|nr:50S ribosomal protein L11 methyltransferase [Magnetococcales bacterium]
MDIKQILQEALAAVNAGQNERALNLCRAALSQDQKRPDSWNLFGLIHQQMEHFPMAATAYRMALDLDPNDAHARQRLEQIRQYAFQKSVYFGNVVVLTLLPHYLNLFKHTVQEGPFRGMRYYDEALSPATPAAAYDIISKLTGWYEIELHPWLREAITVPYHTVINVGCAEGYYAIGLSRCLPQARVYAFDIDANAQRICKMGVELNGVADRIEVLGLCTAERLQQVTQGQRALLMVDCEGCEKDLLDPRLAPALAGCDIIIECHDFTDSTITATLLERFSATHRIDRVEQGPRNPNASALFQDMHELMRWLVLCEWRPRLMHWLRLRSLQYE